MESGDVDLLVFPECFLQGYLLTEEHVHGHAFEFGSVAFATVLATLERIRPVLVIGIIERFGHRYHNTAAVTGTRDDRVGLGPTSFLSPSGEVAAQVPLGDIGMVTTDIPRTAR